MKINYSPNMSEILWNHFYIVGFKFSWISWFAKTTKIKIERNTIFPFTRIQEPMYGSMHLLETTKFVPTNTSTFTVDSHISPLSMQIQFTP